MADSDADASVPAAGMSHNWSDLKSVHRQDQPSFIMLQSQASTMMFVEQKKQQRLVCGHRLP